MVMKEIKSIILYLDSIVAIEHLTDEQAGILIKGVFRYARDGQQLTSSDTALIALFSMLCNQIDRDHKKYEERCERNSANARKRYTNLSQCVQSHPSANDGVPSQANGCLNNNDNKSNNKKDNGNENENKNENDDDTANAIIINKETDVSFETVWEMYGKPVGDKNTIKTMWNELTDQDRTAILAYLPGYIASTPEIRYRKNFNNFLSERYWETHPLKNSQDGINNRPRIEEDEKRKRNVYSTAAEVIAEYGTVSEQSRTTTESV